MARTIIIVNATQLITSESNPQGILSNATGFPQTIDSNNAPYNGDVEYAMKAAKSVYFGQLSANYANTNPARVMTTVTLELADGRQILRESIGAIPAPTPEPEPDEEPVEEPAE